jgi:hypothetical protein
MQARNGGNGNPGPFQVVTPGAILNEPYQAGPIPILNGTPRDDHRESQDAAPASTPPPPPADPSEADARRQAFQAIVAEFVAELRARCLAQTGKEDHFTSRGQTYRWKLYQDETPRKTIITTYKVVEDTLLRSMCVEMNSAGTITSGPAFFKAISEALREAREARAAVATTPLPAPDSRPTMAFSDYQLVAMRNACSFMGQNLLWLGEEPTASRVKLLAECVDMIDAGLAAIGR